MLASDEQFLKEQKQNYTSIPPENEKKFAISEKVERIFSAVGGAIITYATTKALSSEKKNWVHYSMAAVGGLLLLRGTSVLQKKNDDEESNFTSR